MVSFNRAGPVKILCNVHPGMLAYVVVLETPHYTTTDKKGFFHIGNVSAGTYKLNFWCEHRGFRSQEIVLAPGQNTTLHVVLHPEEHDAVK